MDRTRLAMKGRSMSDEQAKKEDLLRLLEGVDSQAARLEAIGQGIVQAARLSRDVAAPVRDIIAYSPSGSLQSGYLDRELTNWQAWQGMANQVQVSQTMVNSFIAVASGTTNTAIGGLMSAVPVDPPPPEPVQAARTRLFQVLDRSRLVDQVRSSMTRLGLNSRGGAARTALELLDEALGALERPVVKDGGPTSVLIPLRESIDAVITKLIRRRPVQARVSGWRNKVHSLGQHCAHSGLPTAHFDRLGTEAEMMMNRLSGFKQLSSSREQLSELFSEGVTFLDALLKSIDERKLKS
jgi:hypothetical protein